MGMPQRYVDVWCVNCGEGQADALTNRCTRCGNHAIQTTTQKAVDRRPPEPPARLVPELPAVLVAAPDDQATVGRIALPDTPEARRWLAQTTAFAQYLREQSEHYLANGRQQNEAHRLIDAAEALTDLLRLLYLRAHKRGRGAQPHLRAAARAGLRWARHFDCCIECGLTTRRHASKGRCGTCLWRYRQSTRPA